jgi:hypothetical protein
MGLAKGRFWHIATLCGDAAPRRFQSEPDIEPRRADWSPHSGDRDGGPRRPGLGRSTTKALSLVQRNKLGDKPST